MYRSNYTIDDSQWSTPSIALSPGWNMLNATSSYFISQDQVDQVRPLLEGLYGGSYSWNTHAGCSNTITFVGMSPSSSSFLLRLFLLPSYAVVLISSPLHHQPRERAGLTDRNLDNSLRSRRS
jgi:hypothetical protein